MRLPERLKVAGFLAASTGLRLGELRALDERSWRPRQTFLVVDRVIIEHGGAFAWRATTESSRARRVPLTPQALRMLERHAAAYPPAVVRLAVAQDAHRARGALRRVEPCLWFTEDDGQPLRKGRVAAAWTRAQVESATGTLGSWHSLRHVYTSAMLGGGMTLARLAALMGHSQDRITALYAHLIDEDQTEARTVMAGVTAAAWRDDELEEEERDAARPGSLAPRTTLPSGRR